MCETIGRTERLSKLAHDSTREDGRAFHRDLLAKNRPGCEFKTVPATRPPKPRTGINLSRQHGIGSKNLEDGCPVRVQVKHGADSLGNKEERPWIAKLQPHHENIAPFIKRNLEVSVVAVQ